MPFPEHQRRPRRGRGVLPPVAVLRRAPPSPRRPPPPSATLTARRQSRSRRRIRRCSFHAQLHPCRRAAPSESPSRRDTPSASTSAPLPFHPRLHHSELPAAARISLAVRHRSCPHRRARLRRGLPALKPRAARTSARFSRTAPLPASNTHAHAWVQSGAVKLFWRKINWSCFCYMHPTAPRKSAHLFLLRVHGCTQVLASDAVDRPANTFGQAC